MTAAEWRPSRPPSVASESDACGEEWAVARVRWRSPPPPGAGPVFSLDELEQALCTDLSTTVEVCSWESGSGAALAARGALAPHVAGAAMLLAGGDAGLRLLLLTSPAAPASPAAPPALWLHHELALRVGLPHLAPIHIRDKKSYVCDACGARFEQPNPLKVHLFLQCAPFSRAAFWRRVLRRLRRAEPATPVPVATAGWPAWGGAAVEAAGEGTGACWPAWGGAAAEALAAAWGRARGPAGAHACLYCGKLYSRRYGLKIHIRTHTGYKPLRCAVCLRAFGDPSNLNKHVRLHARRPHSPAQHKRLHTFC